MLLSDIQNCTFQILQYHLVHTYFHHMLFFRFCFQDGKALIEIEVVLFTGNTDIMSSGKNILIPLSSPARNRT